VSPLRHLKTKTPQFPKVVFPSYLEFRTMDKIHKPSDPELLNKLGIASSGMLRRVVLVKTDVSEELRASLMGVTIGELGTTLAVTSNRRTPRSNTGISSQCASVASYS
jgi:hypothetical protein